ncbi:MAG: GHMP family kinase ATP-binding protein, partial [Planctomycetota bacterium]
MNTIRRAPYGEATATAPTNIALVKYWGKRDDALRLPMNGSISLTLAGLEARTTVCFREELEADTLSINDEAQTGRPLQRVTRFLDRVRSHAGLTAHARVQSTSTIPVAAGLASSAAGFAALAVSASAAAGLDLSAAELSVLARLGSGSACRSIFGGFVEWIAG